MRFITEFGSDRSWTLCQMTRGRGREGDRNVERRRMLMAVFTENVLKSKIRERIHGTMSIKVFDDGHSKKFYFCTMYMIIITNTFYCGFFIKFLFLTQTLIR